MNSTCHKLICAKLTVVLCDLGSGRQASSVDHATSVRHVVFVGILDTRVIIERVHDTQIQNHAVQHAK